MSQPTANPPTVYIVDDDAAVRDALALMLTLHGMRTRVFANFDEALRAADPTWRGCLVLDVQLGCGTNGFDLLVALRGKGVDLPVVVIAGNADVETTRRAEELGIADLHEKPLDDGAFTHAVRRALQGGALDARKPSPA